MAMHYKYTITFSDDHGYSELIEVIAPTPATMNRMFTLMYLGMDQGESIEIEPEPMGQADDLRQILDRRVQGIL